MGKSQVSISVEPELLERVRRSKSKREKLNPLFSASRSKYLVYLIMKGLEIEEKELEEQSRSKIP
jgi:hypothetical protein